MGFDLIGYAEAAPGTGAAVGIAAAGSDDHYRTTGDDIIVKPFANLLLGSYFGCEGAGTTGASYEFKQPGLDINIQFATIGDINTFVESSGLYWKPNRPFVLEKNTKLNVEMDKSADDEDCGAFAWLGSEAWNQSMLDSVRPTHRIIGVCDQTLTVVAWTRLATITWSQDLPRGEYVMTGLRAWTYASTDGVTGYRVIFPGHSKWRPGVLGHTMTGDKEGTLVAYTPDLPMYHWPFFGDFKFDNENLPKFEALCPIATTDHVLELECVKVADR